MRIRMRRAARCWAQRLRYSLSPRSRPRTRGSARRSRCRASCSSTASRCRLRRRPDDEQDRDDGARPASGSTRSPRRRRAGRSSVAQTGSGDNAVIQKVTWTGGKTPTGEDSLFQFLAQPASRQDVHVPGPADLLGRVDRQLGGPGVLRRAGADDRGGQLAGRRRRVGADDHRVDRRRAGPGRGRVRAGQRRLARGAGRWHERAGADRPGAGRGRRGDRRAPSAASAHAYLIKTVPAASGVLDAPPPNVAADLRRGGRAAVRDHLGHQRRRAPGDDGAGHALPGEPGHARRAAAPPSARGLVSDLLAGDLGRRAPGAGRVHLRRRPQPRAGAAVP